MRRLLRRHWLALLVAALTFAILTSTLSPRPLATTAFHLHRQIPAACPEEIILTPNGRLVALTKDNFGCQLTLSNLATSEVLFQTYGMIGQLRLDPDGALVWIDSDKLQREQLFRWDPKTRERRLFADCEYIGSLFELSPDFEGDHDHRIPRHSLLAPDGRTWVIPQVKDQEAWYEAIEIPGDTRRRLASPPLSLGHPGRSLSGMCFTQDSRTLLLHTHDNSAGVLNFHLHWLDVATGRLLHTATLPKELKRIIHATHDLVVAQPRDADSLDTPPEVFAFHGPGKQLSRFSLDEVLSHWKQLASRWPWNRDPRTDVQLTLDPATQSLIATWTYYDESQFSGGPLKATPTPPLPVELHYSIRSLPTGTLQRTGIIPFRPNTTYSALWQKPRLLAVLPGPTLAVLDSRFDAKDGFAGLIDRTLAYFKFPTNTRPDMIALHDTRTDHRLATLALPFGWWNASHTDNTLTLLDRNGTLLTYAYPPHKPWPLILTSTATLLLTTALVTELTKLRRRPKRL